MCALEACRMCLAVDKRMCSIAGTPLQDIYERITNIQLENKDGKPVLGCNVCLHLLKKCQTFIEESVRADETLTRICKAGTEVSRPPRLPPGASRSLSKSAVTCAWYSPWEPPECPVKVEVDVVKAEQLVETTATPNTASTSDTVTVKAPLAAEVCDVKREIVEIEIEATDPLDVKYQPYDCSKWEDEPPMQARQSGFGKVGPISKKSKTKQTSKIKQESSRCKSLPKKDPMYTRSDGVKIESDGASNIRRGKQHQCTQCSKSFDHKGNLIRHIRTHTGEKPYHCSHCSKGFSQKCQIISHIRTHTGEKPYQCSHCSRAFGRKGNLTSHLRTHTGEKPYQCVHCNRSFREKNTLICHVRTHTGEKPFQCSYCGKMFRTPFYLGIHIRRKHTLKEKKSSTSIENK